MNISCNNPTHYQNAIETLKQVIDPEIGLNIVDLGLVYELIFSEDNNTLLVKMTLTTEFCPMGDAIVLDVENKLKEAFPNYTASVNLSFEPPWSYENISEEGKEFLTR
ncbi:hypothetical protein BH09BAC5_BH09BAC5_02980 [soil metagenome]